MTRATTGIAYTDPIRNASPGQAMARFVGNAFQIRGRASRSEYWWWMLVNLIVLSTTQLLIPGLTVAIRRMHDSNLSGWWTLLAFIPIGPFVLLILETRRSRWEGRRFAPYR